MFSYEPEFQPLLEQVTPYGVQRHDPMTELERLQELHLDEMSRDKVRRAGSRAMRRHISGQPKRLVVLDSLRAPGVPWEDLCAEDLPREWVGSMRVTRLEVRRA